jgi:hypothetical protein
MWTSRGQPKVQVQQNLVSLTLSVLKTTKTLMEMSIWPSTAQSASYSAVFLPEHSPSTVSYFTLEAEIERDCKSFA